jgi:hypothetical protein
MTATLDPNSFTRHTSFNLDQSRCEHVKYSYNRQKVAHMRKSWNFCKQYSTGLRAFYSKVHVGVLMSFISKPVAHSNAKIRLGNAVSVSCF